MKWFLAHGLVVLLTLIVVLTIICTANRQSSPSIQLSRLNFEDCELPCWIGIWPGKTTIREARERVKDAFAASNYTRRGQKPRF